MRDRVSYEWTLEFTDQHGDIQESIFDDDLWRLLAEFKSFEPFGERVSVKLGLIKRWGNEYDGETDRTYAYVTETRDGYRIADEFDSGDVVNKSHRKMIEKA
tara:strand:- start:332 stop:637 length:306 start_codon:yes stop_codon:yes gene_type:complete